MDAVTFTSAFGVKHGKAEHSILRVGTSEIPAGAKILLSNKLRIVCIRGLSRLSSLLVIKARALCLAKL